MGAQPSLASQPRIAAQGLLSLPGMPSYLPPLSPGAKQAFTERKHTALGFWLSLKYFSREIAYETSEAPQAQPLGRLKF